MFQLRNVFSYDFNDCIKDEIKKECTHVVVGKKLSPLERYQPRVTRGNRLQTFHVTTPEYCLQMFRKKLDNGLPNIFLTLIHFLSLNKFK